MAAEPDSAAPPKDPEIVPPAAIEDDSVPAIAEEVTQAAIEIPAPEANVEHLNSSKFDYWQAGGKVGKVLDKLAGL